MNRLDAMTAFAAVAEQRGFAPAARRLQLSPSAVTRLVAGLEDHLGIRLLQRTTRSVALTDAGARYLARVRRILADLDEAEASAQAERSTPSGRLVVAAPLLFGRLHVAPLLGELLRRFPAVQAELTLADRPVNLVDEGVDLAVRIGVLADSSLVARRVGTTRRVVVASPAYLRRHGVPRTPAQLGEHATLRLAGLAWSFAGEPLALEHRFTSNSAEVILAQVEAGAGVAMLMGYQVAAGLRAGRLRLLLVDHEPEPLPIHLVYPESRLLSAKVRGFVELVQAASRWQFVELRERRR